MRQGKSGGGNKRGGTKEPPISPEDKGIWDDEMRDVKPLKKKGGAAIENPVSKINRTRRPESRGLDGDYFGNIVSREAQLDRNTDERLRRGLMSLEARLDLHCMTQDQAYAALRNFVRQSYEKGRRCVLVITGTGTRHRTKKDPQAWYEPSPGVLHDRVPQWLREAGIAEMILRFYPAQKRHGGEGALYVLIRRKRER